MAQANKTKLKKKSTTPAFLKNGSHYQSTTISPSHFPAPETFSSTTLSESTTNTNQQ